MENRPVLERLKQARLFQALVVYGGVSWVTLQLVATLKELFELPEWSGYAALILLGVGLVVVTATAWVQSLDSTTRAEEAGEIPTDWQVDPADALASLKKGKLPHLTWGRAIVGGIVAFSLAIGAAGGYVLLTGGAGKAASASGEGRPPGIAVLPFRVSGPGLENYREGLPSLVSTNIDGVEGYRSISTRSVMAAWTDEFGEREEVALEAALGVAGGTGARYAVVGEAVSLGETVRLNADLYDLESEARIGRGESEGPTAELPSLIDEMSVSLLREIIAATGSQTATGIERLAGLITNSVEALNAYVEGEALFGKGQWGGALEAYERAVLADSTFALAWSRIGDTYGWSTTATRTYPDATERALRFADRLPARAITLLEARADADLAIGRIRGDREHLAALRRHTARFPDDPSGWEVLGEYLIHIPSTIEQPGELDRALMKTVELDPTHLPYYIHVLRHLVAIGDQDRFEKHNAARMELVAEDRRYAYQAAWDYFRGSPDAFDRAQAYYSEATPQSLWLTLGEIWMRDEDLLERGLRAVEDLEDRGLDLSGMIGHASVNQGKTIAIAPDSPWRRPLEYLVGIHNVLTGESPAALLSALGEDLQAARAVEDPDERATRMLEDIQMFASAVRLLDAGDDEEALRVLTSATSMGDALYWGYWSWWPILTAEAHARAGNTREAIRYFEDQLNEWRAFSRLRLGELYEEIGEIDSSRNNYERFVMLYADADEFGAALLKRGQDGLARIGN